MRFKITVKDTEGRIWNVLDTWLVRSLDDVVKTIRKDLRLRGYRNNPSEDIEFTVKNNKLQYIALSGDILYIVEIVD